MVKTIVSATDSEGKFVALSTVSEAAEKGGVTREDVLGRELWAFQRAEEAEAIRRALEECIATGKDRHLVTSSTIGGLTESWSVQFMGCLKPASAVVVASQLHAPDGLSVEDRLLLNSIAHDMTAEDIAREEHVSVDAVHTRLRRLREKFFVKSNGGLIGIAMRLKLI